ncbi:MAG: lipoyl synthase [Acidimicrobiia bacterium]|nr:lipoyl synthase [Acidimicrobiia bacterium]
MTLRIRWLGRVKYGEAMDLQRALHSRSTDDYLLLLEHEHVFTIGKRGSSKNVISEPASVGAELIEVDRGGDVTYHGPGQLVGYPIVTLNESPAGMRDVVAHVRRLEDLLIEVLSRLGVQGKREDGLTGVWVGGEKIAAIGVRVARGRTMHGFALNVDPDLAMFDHIVPCGIEGRGVTSIASQLDNPPSMKVVVDLCSEVFAEMFGREDSDASPDRTLDRADVAWEYQPRDRVAPAGAARDTFRRPEWMKVRADLGSGYRELKALVSEEELHTVCEEARCPNIYECWAQRTATFMILGDRCTRACGFCLVDSRRPIALDHEEPVRVAEAVARLGLAHAVLTSVARDDLPDGGAEAFASTVEAVARRNPTTTIEVLIPDFKGNADSLATLMRARPAICNHNLETVARLQRAARPSASYARSLVLLARAKDAGLVTKSGIIMGMGETEAELRGAIADLRAVGVEILTLGQYLRPSIDHLPVARWWTPDEFESMGDYARGLGFAHVESGPLVRSSYHARAGAAAVAEQPVALAVS